MLNYSTFEGFFRSPSMVLRLVLENFGSVYSLNNNKVFQILVLGAFYRDIDSDDLNFLVNNRFNCLLFHTIPLSTLCHFFL